MNKITLSFIKRTVIYPLIVGYLTYFLAMEVDPELKANTLEMLYSFNDSSEMYFHIKIPDSIFVAVFFYFFGYIYGLISTVFGVRKFRSKGIRLGIFLSLLVWCTKISLSLFHAMFGPLILLLDVFVSFIRVAIIKRRKSKRAARNQFSFEDDLYYEESHR